MTPESEAILGFDVDEVLLEAEAHESRRSLEEREEAAFAVTRARLEAAAYLVDHGSPSDALLAAEWLLAGAA